MSTTTKINPEPFNASDFNDNNDTTAEKKAKVANLLVTFIVGGFKPTQFTNELYKSLYVYMFDHIAHYNKGGFFEEWFASPYKQLCWIQYVLTSQTHDHTEYAEIEHAIKRWLRGHDHDVVEAIREASDESQRKSSMSIAARALANLSPEDRAAAIADADRNRVGTIKVICFGVSSNTNSFGLYGMRLMTHDGEYWEAAANSINVLKNRQVIQVPFTHDARDNRDLNFSKFGFEIPELKRTDAPDNVLKEVWGDKF